MAAAHSYSSWESMCKHRPTQRISLYIFNLKTQSIVALRCSDHVYFIHSIKPCNGPVKKLIKACSLKKTKQLDKAETFLITAQAKDRNSRSGIEIANYGPFFSSTSVGIY